MRTPTKTLAALAGGLFLIAIAVVGPVAAGEIERWVPPPAPMTVDATPIQPVAEVRGDGDYIIHLPKPSHADWRLRRYQAVLRRGDDQRLVVTLETVPFVRDDEVVFITVPVGAASKYELEILDRGTYPFGRVFKGLLSEIPPLVE
jgi:hypothetical protein